MSGRNRHLVTTLAALTLVASVALGSAPDTARATTPSSDNGGTLTCDVNSCTDTFGVDGATPSTAMLQTFVAPPGVTAVTVTVDGAGAASSPAGGKSTGTLATTGGTAYQVLVGAQGYHANGNAGTPATAGGGGAGGNSFAADGGESGGGGSFVFDGSGTLLLAAGGAGGAGGVGDPNFVCAGGTGGGAGADASDSGRVNGDGLTCGSGGDAQGSTPGAGTDTYPGSPGGQLSGTTPGSGGKGADEYQSTYSAGGGGGGYAGGAGGSATDAPASTVINTPGGGGGGSGYAAASVTGVTGMAGGGSTGDGSVSFTWASTFGSTSCVAATATLTSQCTDAFGTSTSPQAFVVPPGVSSLTTTALGAGYQKGGGMSVGTLASSAGTVLPVLVGEASQEQRTAATAGGGGVGGGTSGINGVNGNGGSFLFDATGAPLLVAGGEGGNAPFTGCFGGAGGSATTPADPATAVYGSNTMCHPGQPGTTSGGAGGSAGGGGSAGADGQVSMAFTAGLGGTGGRSMTGQAADQLGGGGGGGGYAGGGGGGGLSLDSSSDRAGGGGGGSGYAAPGLTAVSGVSGSHEGNGQLNIAYTSGATQLVGPGTSSAQAGVPFSFTVEPSDGDGDATPWGGSLKVTGGGAGAVLPANATVSGGPTASLSVTFHTAGTQTVTVTDPAGRLATLSFTVTVTPGPASQLLLSPATADVQIGTAQAYSANTADQYGNVIAADTAVTYTINDALGSCTASSCTPVTPGSHTVTGKDGALSGTAMLTGDALATTSLAASVPAGASTTAGGAAVTMTVTPGGAVQGLPATYTGQVMFTSSDPHAVLPATQTFTAAANGSETFQVTFKTAGMQTVTVSDPASPPPGGVGAVASGTTGAVTVTAAQVASLAATTTATTATAGDSAHPAPVTVTAYDSYGNSVPSYTGTVHLTSGTDPKAVLPVDYTFTAGDAGAHTFAVTFATVGQQTVTATDTATATLSGTTGDITVVAGPTARLDVSTTSTSVVAGGSVPVVVVPRDTYGNVATYSGTVHLTSTDAKAVLPADATFSPGANGSETYQVTLATAGSQTVTAVDPAAGDHVAAGTTSTVTVAPGPADHLTLSPGQTQSQANTGVTYTAVVNDAQGNAIGTDTAVSYTITPDGSCTGDVCTPTAAGPHTVTGTDTSNNAVQGTASLTATADPATHFALSSVSTSGHEVAMPVTAGNTSFVTVTAEDAANKPVPFSGMVTVTSDDARPQAASVRTASHTFTGESAYSFTMTVTKSPTTTYTATTDDPTVTSGQLTLDGVKPGPAATLSLSPASASVPLGSAQPYTAQALDAYGNDTGSTDSAATYAMDGGSCTAASCVPTAAGPHTVTATDGQGSSALSGTAALTGTPVTLTVSAPSTATAGTPVTATVTATTSGTAPYTGTVHFADSDTRAGLPDDYTFTAADNGSQTFGVTLLTAGSTVLSATDVTATSVTANTAVQVSAGPIATLTLSPAHATVPVGQGQAYTAVGTDGYGNSLGDVTAATRFAVAPDGACAGNTCQAAAAGTHGVTGTDAGATGTAELDATAPAPAGPAATAGPAAPTAPVAPAPVLTLHASKSVIGYGQKVTLSGRLTQAGAGLAGQTVVLTDAFTGDRAKPIGAVKTGPDGSWRLIFAPAYNGVVTAGALATRATTKVGVRESYTHLRIVMSATTVKITGRLTPGFVPKAHTKLRYVITATSGKKVLTRIMTAPQRTVPRGLNHGYVPISVQFALPVGRYRLTLTVTGVPASTSAPTRAFRVTVHEPKVE